MEPFTVTLELCPPADEGSPHADGVVVLPDGTRHTFSGWMALLGVLEAIVVESGTRRVPSQHR